MLKSLFNSTSSSVELWAILVCTLVSIILGVIVAYTHKKTSKYSKNFLMTLAILPVLVQTVMIMVNGNLGTSVAIVGAFSLVRFRSAAGTAKEICIIFVSMATGLAFGIGYVAYASIFAFLCGALLMLAGYLNVWEPRVSDKDRVLKVTIPESLDYQEVFKDLFAEYTTEVEMLRVKTINMGSMFRLTYRVKFKDASKEKEFIDKVRCRNGNLEVALEREEFTAQEL